MHVQLCFIQIYVYNANPNVYNANPNVYNATPNVYNANPIWDYNPEKSKS